MPTSEILPSMVNLITCKETLLKDTSNVFEKVIMVVIDHLF